MKNKDNKVIGQEICRVVQFCIPCSLKTAKSSICRFQIYTGKYQSLGQPERYTYVFNFVEENNVLYNNTERIRIPVQKPPNNTTKTTSDLRQDISDL